MKKSILRVICLSVFLLLCLIYIPLFAEEADDNNETITLVTYYPAPIGIYSELRAKRMAIGEGYYDPGEDGYCFADSGTCVPTDDQFSTGTGLAVEGNVTIGTNEAYSWNPLYMYKDTHAGVALETPPGQFAGYYLVDKYYGWNEMDGWGIAKDSNRNLTIASWDKTNVTNRLFIDKTSGNLGIGTMNPEAQLDVASTTSGFIPPRMTLAERNLIPTPAEGSIVYNTTDDELNYRDSTSWQALGGGGSPGSWNCSLKTSTNGGSGQAQCNCPSGSQLINGGCHGNLGFGLYDSYPDSKNSWSCYAIGLIGCYALCCK